MTGCGGVASYYGPCGAYDCSSCYPVSRFPDDEDETPTYFVCVDGSWAPLGERFEDSRAFRQAMKARRGVAPNLTRIDGGWYDYSNMRYVLRAVYLEAEDDEPTEEMTLAVG